MSELKPCPFCGGAAFLRELIEHYPASADGPAGSYSAWVYIGCEVCGIEVGEEYESTAAEAWNRRAPTEAAPAPAQPTDAQMLDSAYEAGWCAASRWARREDLIADIGSFAYEAQKRAAMTSKTPAEGGAGVPDGVKEPIPSGVYWAPLADNFYSAEGQGQGLDFYRKWKPRRAEFPQGESAGWGKDSAHNPFKDAPRTSGVPGTDGGQRNG